MVFRKVEEYVWPSKTAVRLKQSFKGTVAATAANVDWLENAHNKWNSFKDSDGVLGSDVDLIVGWRQIAGSYNKVLSESGMFSVKVQRHIQEGDAESTTQHDGLYVYIYTPPDNVTTKPPWAADVSTQQARDEAIRQMKADPNCSWGYIKPVYDNDAATANSVTCYVKHALTSRRNLQFLLKNEYDADQTNRTNQINAATLEVDVIPVRSCIVQNGIMSERYNSSIPETDWIWTKYNNCIFYNRQIDQTTS